VISCTCLDKSSGLAVVVVGGFRSTEEALLEVDMAKLSPQRRAIVQASILVSGIAFQATGCGEIRYRDAIVGNSNIQRIIVKGDVGVIAIVPGTQVRVDFAVRAPEGAALIQHHEYDGILEVRSSCRTPILCAVDAEVHVPAGVPVQVELDRGEVWSTGVDSLDISVGEGDVDIDTDGPATVQIGHGAARVTSKGTSNIRVAVGSGDIDVHVPAGAWNVDVTAANESITGVSIDPNARGSIELVAPAGSVRVVGRSINHIDSGSP
jgi:hypothetical protein